jgi:hypothetical protein
MSLRMPRPDPAQVRIVAGVEHVDQVPGVGEPEVPLLGELAAGRRAVLGQGPQLARHRGRAHRLEPLALERQPDGCDGRHNGGLRQVAECVFLFFDVVRPRVEAGPGQALGHPEVRRVAHLADEPTGATASPNTGQCRGANHRQRPEPRVSAPFAT